MEDDICMVQFVDIDTNEKHYGIYIKGCGVVCGCCGSLFPEDEKEDTWTLTKILPWSDIEKAISGE